MNQADFQPDCPGRLEPTTFTEHIWRGDQWEARDTQGFGFLPDPLPPRLDLTDTLIYLYPQIIEAERNLSHLDGTASRLKNPHLLIGVFSRREAIQSSAIEDTFASAEDLALFEHAPSQIEDRSDVREVANYVRALEHGLGSKLPICLRLIREMHGILLDGVQRPGVQPGEFRTTQNAIGAGKSFATAKFVPPPPEFLDQCLNTLEAYLHQKDSILPRLVRFALIHYQFETIHPFADGNGRLGRLLIALMLCKQAQLSKPLVYVSGYFEQHRAEYCDRLYRVSTENAWQAWIAFFLEAVATQSHDAIQRANRLLDLQAQWLEAVQEKRASPLLSPLVELLFSNPSVTAAQITQRFKCSAPTASNLIKRLVAKKILLEYTGRARDQVFIAPQIIELIKN